MPPNLPKHYSEDRKTPTFSYEEVVAKSLLDLAFEYVEVAFPTISPSSLEKREAIQEITDLLEQGYLSEDIETAIIKLKNNNSTITPGKTLIQTFREIPLQNNNLLEPNKFYYHNELRIMPGAPIICVDYNTGNITKSVTEYFLEMRASYSITDLQSYYCRQMRIKLETNHNGALMWICRKYGIDTTLFAIDATANHYLSEDIAPPNNPFVLIEYIGQARLLRDYKITETKSLGDDRVVPKRRILSSRGGSIATQELQT